MRVPVEMVTVIEDAKLGLPPKTNLHLVTDNDLLKELERRGLKASPPKAQKVRKGRKSAEQKAWAEKGKLMGRNMLANMGLVQNPPEMDTSAIEGEWKIINE